ncbi:sugar phosphate isomerase/epimerase family protein [Mesorhizobium sp. WSM3224]|uniref:sugar phosphate isomerase/epimerase family protein n=1 Tax=Mesorhizobium sp. WSM3224 TaxID=1040986 RepID=UPI0003FC711F|nr:sugar phosphate isomerase/epimerase family protein [Mesorhizobium sp. WSM3224]
MRLSVTSWSFPQLTLDEVGGLARVLGIEAIDVGYFYRSALDKARLLREPEAYGEEIRKASPVAVSNLYHLFGNSVAERNLASPAYRRENLTDFQQALKFCVAVGSPTVFILPGVINGAQSRMQALAETVESLKPLLDAAAPTGVSVCVEPHVHSYLESPAMTADMCERAAGVKLAIDYAHFAVSGYRQEEIDALAPWFGHAHLRQARPGALQTKLDEGTLNFPAMFSTFRDAGFSGWLACEYVHQGYFDTVHDDVLTETVKMRDLFRAWSAA